jgi:polar amino acid transport system substrate-binding protein
MMKKTLLTFTSFAALFFLFSFPAFSADKIMFVVDDRPPFHSEDGKGNIVGVSVNVVRCIMEKMNRQYELKVEPWARAQASVEKGKADGMFSASKNDERDQYAVLSNPICDQYWNWYVLKDSNADPNSPDFKSKAKVGSWFGSNSLDWLLKNGYNAPATPRGADQLVDQLLMGRVDAVFGSNVTIEEAIKAKSVSDKIKTIQGLSKPMGVYFSKKFLEREPKFLEEFNSHVGSCMK